MPDPGNAAPCRPARWRLPRWWPVAAVGVASTLWALVALDARATYGARTTADEPQYLLSALSLAEDHDLDIGDELAEQRWRDFHEAPLPVQTEPLADGTVRSPHDPLLPAYLAVPVGIGGWAGAKAAMAVIAGMLASAIAWVGWRRFGLRPLSVATVVAAFCLTAPLTAYGTQLYPELPAALAVTVALGAGTGRLGRGGWAVLVVAVVALPWLGVKYAPAAAALAALGLVRTARRRPLAALAAAGVLALAGVAYLVAHRVLYGGWTVYAAGDHFVGGEWTVTGTDPDRLARTGRLWGLLVDRGFGLAAWSPVYLVAVPALAGLLRRRPPGAAWLCAPLAAGWATATWVALTMHGWWWPGRQTVVVLPCAVLAVCWWVERVVPAARRAVVALGAVGVVVWAWLVAEVLAGDRALIVDFEATSNPLFRAWHAVLPDFRRADGAARAHQALWLVGLALLAAWGWRRAAPRLEPGALAPTPTRAHPSAPSEMSPNQPSRRSQRVPV